MKLFFTILALILVSQSSFAKDCDTAAISAALKEHQNSAFVDTYIMTHYEVVGQSLENNSLFTVVRLMDSNYATFYTVEQNPVNCKVRKIH